MVLFLREEDVTRLVTMEDALEVVEEAFKQQGIGATMMPPRVRVSHDAKPGYLAVMPAAMPHLGYAGLKAYTPSKEAAFRFIVLLYDMENWELLSVMAANHLGQLRTGAASGVATKYLSRKDSEIVGIIGSGFQAETQLQAICAVRRIALARVYSRNAEHRREFAKRMTMSLGVEVVAADSPAEVVKSADIVITATTSKQPLFDGRLLEEGVHINAVGSNFPSNRELDDATIRKAKLVVDDREQAMLEAGDILIPLKSGIISAEHVYAELGEIVTGRKAGRISDKEITIFKSVGIAIEDVALASRLYEKALRLCVGSEIGA